MHTTELNQVCVYCYDFVIEEQLCDNDKPLSIWCRTWYESGNQGAPAGHHRISVHSSHHFKLLRVAYTHG